MEKLDQKLHLTLHSNPSSSRTSPIASKKHTPSPSGKHTPVSSNAPTGDYGEFLKASQLQEALEREREKAELKLEKERRKESTKGKLFSAFKHHHPSDGRKSKASKGKDSEMIKSSKNSKKDKGGSRRQSLDCSATLDGDDGDHQDELGRFLDREGEVPSDEGGSEGSSRDVHFPGDIFHAERAQKKDPARRPLSRSSSMSYSRRKSSFGSHIRPILESRGSSSSTPSNRLPQSSSSSFPNPSTSPTTSPTRSTARNSSSGLGSHLLPPALCGEVSDSDSTDEEEARRIPGDDSEAEREAEKELEMEELERKRSAVEIGNGKVKPFSKSLGGESGRRRSSSSSLKKQGSSSAFLDPAAKGTLIKEDTTSSDSDSVSEAESAAEEEDQSRSRLNAIKPDKNALSDSQITERASSSQPSPVYGNRGKDGKIDGSSNASLKSWTGTDAASTISGASLASGGANQALSKPLLELEELELESFLKNFGRHTREVRVPASANFPRRRMPQWSDFRVPANEAALAAQQGKRITVLSHVDRGLQALLESEGAGGAQPRHPVRPEDQHPSSSGNNPRNSKKKTKEKEKAKKKDKDKEKEKIDSSTTSAGDSDGADEEAEHGSSGKHMKVTWDPSTGFQHSAARMAAEKEAAHHSPDNQSKRHSLPLFGSMRKRASYPSSSSNPGISEKEAKLEAKKLQDEISRALSVEKKQAQDKSSHSSENLHRDSAPSLLPKNRESLETIDVHDERKEYRPSRDERDSMLNEADWTLIEPGEGLDRAREVEVDSHRDEKVDGIAFCIAYILALVERYAPEQLDDAPDQSFRESKARSHLERVYLIAPFWEGFLFGLRRLYRWDDPRRTGLFFMGYFVLWYTDLIPTAFLLYLMFNICRYRFFPPDASVLHDAVRRRMMRGIEADKLANQLRRRSRLDVYQIYNRFIAKYGADLQSVLGDVADAHEMIKNLILWRNPTGTWRTLGLFGVVTTFVTLAPAHLVWKMFFFFIGFTFFCLMPLQSHYPRYRRPLSPIWWVLWGSPTDAQFAVQLLRRRHLENAAAGVSDHLNKKHKSDFTGGPSSAAHAVAHGGLDNDIYDETFDQIHDETFTTASGRQLTKPKKLGSFYCLHHGVPGHLHVTAERLYFVGIHAAAVGPKGKTHKVCKTPLSDVAGLVKTKSKNLIFYRSAGLQVVRKDGKSIFFSNMAHRDDAFNLLLAVGSDTHIWTKV